MTREHDFFYLKKVLDVEKLAVYQTKQYECTI